MHAARPALQKSTALWGALLRTQFRSVSNVRIVRCLVFGWHMRRPVALWGVFVTRFEDALERFRRRSIGAEEAGELLGVCGRQFRRLCVRLDDEGADGLRDRRLGRISPRRSDGAEIGRICGLYRDRYRDFTVKHFNEALVAEHDYKLFYTVTRLALQAAGLVTSQRPPFSAWRSMNSRSAMVRRMMLRTGSKGIIEQGLLHERFRGQGGREGFG